MVCDLWRAAIAEKENRRADSVNEIESLPARGEKPNYKTEWSAYEKYQRSIRLKRALEAEALETGWRVVAEFVRAVGERIWSL
jgi:hypothetical protein